MLAVVRLFRRYRLPFISFFTGFGLLTYELAAARVLAPSIGSSTYVWTGVIGVIIAALSLGFFAGGKLADRRNRSFDLVWLLALASLMVTLTVIGYEDILQTIVQTIEDSRLQAVLAALILFAPASFFIGTTSPYLAKLSVQSLKSTGQTVAGLDMFNAVGGIAGTFVTGFILFGYIGSREAIGLVAVLLLLLSWTIEPRKLIGRRLIVSAAILLVALTPAATRQGVIDIDTASAHYKVMSGLYEGRLVTGLFTGPGGTQSAVYQNGLSDPVFWYTGEMARLTIEKQPGSVLLLGGGAFTLPQFLSEQLPDSTIDVVEIDPELGSISAEYFNYEYPANVNEIYTDARTYLNQTKKSYDVVLVDVYGDATIPFSLITKEYGQALAKTVKPDGLVIANIIGGFSGECRNTFAAVDAAYREQFPNVQYSNESGQQEARANHVVTYARSKQNSDGMRPLPSFGQEAYTDNYAPAERLYYDCESARV